MMNGHIAGRITKLREEKDLSQSDLAEAANVPESALFQIESALRPARMDEVIAVAWALGVSVAAILDEHPLAERIIVHTHPARQDPGADSVKRRLVGFLEADAQLEETSRAAENCGQ